MKEIASNDVSTLLRQLRKERGLDIVSSAKSAGFSSNYLSLMERGKMAPTRDHLARLAYVYEFPVGELLQEAGFKDVREDVLPVDAIRWGYRAVLTHPEVIDAELIRSIRSASQIESMAFVLEIFGQRTGVYLLDADERQQMLRWLGIPQGMNTTLTQDQQWQLQLEVTRQTLRFREVDFVAWEEISSIAVELRSWTPRKWVSSRAIPKATVDSKILWANLPPVYPAVVRLAVEKWLDGQLDNSTEQGRNDRIADLLSSALEGARTPSPEPPREVNLATHRTPPQIISTPVSSQAQDITLGTISQQLAALSRYVTNIDERISHVELMLQDSCAPS